MAISLLGAGLLQFTRAYGDDLLLRSLEISDSRISTVATYRVGFTLPGSEVLGSIRLQFCANDPLIGQPCTAPGGFDVSAVALSSQLGETGFIVLPSGTNANTVVLSRVPSATTATNLSYELANVTNPNAVGTYYARLETFSTADASGANTNKGGLAFSMNAAIQITTTVPPFLLFCSGVTITGFDCNGASGNYINMGTLNAHTTASAQSQLLTATNAADGFTVSAYGLTMTSGNNVIDGNSAADVSRLGVSQFGLNLTANTTPLVGRIATGPGNAMPFASYNTPDFYKFVSGDPIAGVSAADDFRKLTVSYITNMQPAQPAGVYVATLTYICLANF